MTITFTDIRAILLCGAALPALVLASPAAAQDSMAGEAPAEGEEEGEILVIGSIRSAQEASIDAKRQALNLTDVAAADVVGRFPDQNAAAALSRLPAVAVQRDQGQERYIQVRGAPNRWTSVSIDGVPLTGVDEGGDSRAFRFDAIPAVLLSSLVINKSLTADLQADAIVATIDLRTYSPRDQEGFSISGDLGYGFMELGEGPQRQAALRLSWSNDRFGITVGGSHYRRVQLTDNREVGLYDANGPTEFDIRQYQIERWNNGLFAGVEFAATDNLTVWAKGIFTEFNDNERRNQYEFRIDRPGGGGVRTPTRGDLVAVPVRGSFNFGEYRNRNTLATLGGDFENDSGLTAALRLNYARTVNTTYLPLVQASTSSSGAASPSLTYDASDPRFPIVTLFPTIVGAGGVRTRGTTPLTAFDQRTLSAAGTILIDARQETFVDAYTAKLDLAQEFDSGLKITGGLYYVDREITGNNFSFSNVALLGPTGFNVNSYVTDTPWVTNFPLGVTLNYVDNIAMRRDIDTLLAQLTTAGTFNPANSIPATDRYAQNEKIAAAYISGQQDFGALTVIAGLRLENYELDNAGSARIGATFVPLNVPQSATDLFPSLNLRFAASDDLIIRLAGQRGVSRPAYGQIRVGASINDTASPGTIAGGNPGLLPEYTWGVDAAVEYYLPGNGILAVTGFYRWVDNVFFSRQQLTGSDVFDFGGIDRSNYLLTSTFNGENGKLYGVEFNLQNQFDFLPSPLDGFGFQGNLTLLGGSFDVPAVGTQVAVPDIAFPGTSDTIINLSLFYEKAGFSGRVSYQWRSDWLDTIGGLGAGEFRQGYANLDVTLRYELTPELTLFADLANLTDEKYIAYQDRPNQPSEVEQIGRRYLFGVRFNF